MMKHITREEAKQSEAPFNMRPLTDFIKKIVEEIDSVKVYETCYEVTNEDFEGNPSLGRVDKLTSQWCQGCVKSSFCRANII